MNLELTPKQAEFRAACRAFVDEQVIPFANCWDHEERTPPEIIAQLAKRGYLGATVPEKWGGLGLDSLSLGLLNEEFGRGCSSLRSLLTVHGMVCMAIQRFGTAEQQTRWLPKLAKGELIGAFALSEPGVGSDAKRISTAAEQVDGGYELTGHKKWITYGQVADLFLTFALCQGEPAAILVERTAPGFSIEPIRGMLGTRAALLAEVRFDRCEVPEANLLGRVGFGLSYVATTCLDYGRFTIAWGCVGIGQACLEESLRYTSEREQSGRLLRDHQLIQKMITEMVVQVQAARLLCARVCQLREAGDPQSFAETWVAKYFASTMLPKLTSDAVQVHGARGCSQEANVQRFYRDAKVMELIEGSTQLHEIIIAQNAYQQVI